MNKRIFSMLCFLATVYSAATMAQGLSIGESAPNFTLEDHDAYRVSFTDFRGKMVVLEWVNPNCPQVKRYYEQNLTKNLAQKYRAKDFVYIAINSTPKGTKEINKQWLTSHQLPYSILDDHDGKVAEMYGADRTPMFFIFNKDHKLVFKGALDNDPSGTNPGNQVKYVENALNELKAGKPVSVPQSNTYGCKIKTAQ